MQVRRLRASQELPPEPRRLFQGCDARRCVGRIRQGTVVATSGRFQYLKGAIGRLLPTFPTCPQSPFNTSKVRLEASSTVSTVSARCDFQYLKGAIGRGRRRAFAYEVGTFNTSKVRLEDSSKLDRSALGATFNTSKVRLEATSNCDPFRPRATFNTSKVRLEGNDNAQPADQRILSIPQRCDWKQAMICPAPV